MDDTDATTLLQTVLENVADRVADEREYLTELDSKIGDADFGANLHRGCQAALEAVDELDDPTPAEYLETVGKTLLDEMAGSSGIIFGMSLMKASAELESGVTPETLVAFTNAFRDNVAERGDVDVGSKTLYDILVPVADTLQASVEMDADEDELIDASARMVEAARRGAMFTAALRAKRGRASYTEWRSVGHPDPGAVGILIILQEIHSTAEAHVGETRDPSFKDGFG
ncbi:dihydroxyacetone kinase subunit DhaL [Halobium palmae]|uniref:Dihydroxyacetone kinase subunit DhaL n=1 Tax=Halobium palmae TaxID=1776492 RepID=A0ABD5RX29_9EURY